METRVVDIINRNFTFITKDNNTYLSTNDEITFINQLNNFINDFIININKPDSSGNIPTTIYKELRINKLTKSITIFANYGSNTEEIYSYNFSNTIVNSTMRSVFTYIPINYSLITTKENNKHYSDVIRDYTQNTVDMFYNYKTYEGDKIKNIVYNFWKIAMTNIFKTIGMVNAIFNKYTNSSSFNFPSKVATRYKTNITYIDFYGHSVDCYRTIHSKHSTKCTSADIINFGMDILVPRIYMELMTKYAKDTIKFNYGITKFIMNKIKYYQYYYTDNFDTSDVYKFTVEEDKWVDVSSYSNSNFNIIFFTKYTRYISTYTNTVKNHGESTTKNKNTNKSDFTFSDGSPYDSINNDTDTAIGHTPTMDKAVVISKPSDRVSIHYVSTIRNRVKELDKEYDFGIVDLYNPIKSKIIDEYITKLISCVFVFNTPRILINDIRYSCFVTRVNTTSNVLSINFIAIDSVSNNTIFVHRRNVEVNVDNTSSPHYCYVTGSVGWMSWKKHAINVEECSSVGMFDCITKCRIKDISTKAIIKYKFGTPMSSNLCTKFTNTPCYASGINYLNSGNRVVLVPTFTYNEREINTCAVVYNKDISDISDIFHSTITYHN